MHLKFKKIACLNSYHQTPQSEIKLIAFSVQIFVKYYGEFTPGVNFASQVMNNLLISLLKNCLLQEVFQILNITVRINTLVGDLVIFFKSLIHSFSRFLRTMPFEVIRSVLLKSWEAGGKSNSKVPMIKTSKLSD